MASVEMLCSWVAFIRAYCCFLWSVARPCFACGIATECFGATLLYVWLLLFFFFLLLTTSVIISFSVWHSVNVCVLKCIF